MLCSWCSTLKMSLLRDNKIVYYLIGTLEERDLVLLYLFESISVLFLPLKYIFPLVISLNQLMIPGSSQLCIIGFCSMSNNEFCFAVNTESLLLFLVMSM